MFAQGGSASGGKSFKAITIGKYGEKICKKLNVPIFASFITFSEYSTIEQTEELSGLVSEEFKKGEYQSVKFYIPNFKINYLQTSFARIISTRIETVKNVVEVLSLTDK